MRSVVWRGLVHGSPQRYEPIGGRSLRVSSDSFVAGIIAELDVDGLGGRCEGLAERLA